MASNESDTVTRARWALADGTRRARLGLETAIAMMHEMEAVIRSDFQKLEDRIRELERLEARREDEQCERLEREDE